MIYKKMIQELEIKIKQKNIIIVEGNINDIFLKEKDGIWNLEEIIQSIIFNKTDFEEIVHFIPGLPKWEIEKETWKEAKKILPSEGKKRISFDNFLDDLNKELNDENENRKVYIIDSTDIQLDNQNAQIPTQQLSGILSSVLNKYRKKWRDYIKTNHSSKIIFLARDAGNFWNLFLNKNVEYAKVNIPKPNFEVRKEFFEKYGFKFKVKDNEEIAKNGPQQNQAISLTDKLSLREISQIAKTSHHDEKFENISFKELFFIIQFNKKDSEWEKIDEKRLKEIDGKLEKRVYGQKEAIRKIKTLLIRSKLGFSGFLENANKNKPKGVLFFGGPTGVGKTELAKAITEFIFHDESKLIRFDMSEYNHEHSDQRLIGAPPGYVGYDSGGELTNKVKENPFSILLFDEIEKAHGKILDKFLQILEDGRLTSSKGELIDFSETLIIFTSNIGSNETSPNDKNEKTRKNFKNAIIKHFKEKLNRPEILNRISEKNIVPFNYINDDQIINNIINSKIDKFKKFIKEKYFIKIDFKKNDDFLNLINKKYDRKNGGRGIISVIEKYFVDNLSHFIFENIDKIKSNIRESKINDLIFKIDNNKIVFEFKN